MPTRDECIAAAAAALLDALDEMEAAATAEHAA